MKDFYRITDMSAEFQEWQKHQGESKEPLSAQTEIQLWQARFMLAIAQQVSIVANYLGKIVRKAEQPNA